MAFPTIQALARRFAMIFAVILLVPAMAFGQAGPVTPPQTYNPIDGNGVNLISGAMTANTPTIWIGPKGGGLSYSQNYDSGKVTPWTDTANGMVATSTLTNDPWYTVTMWGQAFPFKRSGSTFTAAEDNTATLVMNGSDFTLTLLDGTVATYAGALSSYSLGVVNNLGSITQIVYPNNRRVTFSYSSVISSGAPVHRLQSVNSSDCYQLHFDFAIDNNTNGDSNPVPSDWYRITKVTALNNAFDACGPNAFSCSYSRIWPSLTFADITGARTVTDALNRTTYYLFTSGILTGIRRPGRASGQDLLVAYDTNQIVSQVTTDFGAYGYVIPDAYKYGFPTAPNQVTIDSATTVTDPLGHQKTVTSRSVLVDLATHHRVTRMRAFVNGVNKGTLYGYTASPQFRLSTIQQPESNYISYGYDTRGNITSVTKTPKSGSGLSAASMTAIYPGCTSSTLKTCNQPSSVTDYRGATTDYTYDDAHGGLLTATAPAPTSGAVRPQTRYAYQALSAWYKDAGGSIVQAAAPIYVQTGTSACVTLASCAGGTDEVKTSTTYQVGNSGTASNLFALSTTSGNGTGTLAATTAMTYNARGDIITVDGPIPGTGDTTRSFFDSVRQKNAEIRADPDGGGSLLYPATVTTYNADGQVTLVQTGTTTSQADTSSFVTLEQAQTDYDIAGRKVKDSFYASGATQTVAQYAYDAANRLVCSTVRMNPSVFGSLPSDACTLGTTGSDGPDRVTRTDYDAADRVTQITSGYNSGTPRIEQTLTYTDNGKPQTLADGKSNLTTNEYDGFDRLQKVRYPNTSGGGSSTTDFDLYGYDANDNRTSWQRRGFASPITFTFDALNRQTSGLRGEAYAFDNLSRQTSASIGGSAVTLGYDALGRMLTETAYGYAMAYQYDLAGNRTRITWPDSVYVTYDYDNLYRTTAAKESGVSTLVGVAYDNLGRRTALTRLNGVTTSYGYDAASRLSSITHDLAGATNDQTITLAYTAASQIRTKTGSNSLYDWTGSQITGTYTANGLNQITAAGSRAPTYDPRGNMTNDGILGFTYDNANNLVTSTINGGTTIDFDALSRFRAISQGGGVTSLAYSGPDIVSEFDNSGTLFRRYVPGPNPDEHWVWYNGSGTSDRRYYLQDQIGSVIGLADNAGGAYAINAYDEYGVPRAGNQGRYQYTGQAWLGSLGFYSYKARMYYPSFGRFLQTDPTGYDDGLNWYAYVGNDPLNQTDPTGEDAISCSITYAPDGSTAGPKCTGSQDGSGTTTVTVRTNYQYVDDKGHVQDNNSTVRGHFAGDLNSGAVSSYVDSALSGAMGSPTHLVTGSIGDRLAGAATSILSAMGPPGSPGSQSTGRTQPQSLKEKLAMEQARSNPGAGQKINLTGGMKDSRWSGGDGWVKMRQNVNGTEVHYNYNTRTGATADWKFK